MSYSVGRPRSDHLHPELPAVLLRGQFVFLGVTYVGVDITIQGDYQRERIFASAKVNFVFCFIKYRAAVHQVLSRLLVQSVPIIHSRLT